jgi:hypothetical protein
VGQFESDNRMDENLERIILEGGGGGHNTESYELAMYFMARHTSIDCFEQRGKKGYLFLIGDENAYRHVSRAQVEAVIGDGLQKDIPLGSLVAELKRRYEVFYILPADASHGGERAILWFWRALLGQNVLELDDPEAVCETIALAIGLCEGAIDLSDGLADLKDFGVGSHTVHSVSTALAPLATGMPARAAATAALRGRTPQGEALPRLVQYAAVGGAAAATRRI